MRGRTVIAIAHRFTTIRSFVASSSWKRLRRQDGRPTN